MLKGEDPSRDPSFDEPDGRIQLSQIGVSIRGRRSGTAPESLTSGGAIFEASTVSRLRSVIGIRAPIRPPPPSLAPHARIVDSRQRRCRTCRPRLSGMAWPSLSKDARAPDGRSRRSAATLLARLRRTPGWAECSRVLRLRPDRRRGLRLPHDRQRRPVERQRGIEPHRRHLNRPRLALLVGVLACRLSARRVPAQG
jgi:hypothetical protein